MELARIQDSGAGQSGSAAVFLEPAAETCGLEGHEMQQTGCCTVGRSYYEELGIFAGDCASDGAAECYLQDMSMIEDVERSSTGTPRLAQWSTRNAQLNVDVFRTLQ